MSSLLRRVSQSFGSLRSSRSTRSSIISTVTTSTSTSTSTTTTGNKEMILLGSSEVNQISYKENKEMLVMASIKAPMFEKKEEDKRAPIDLCCVIDKSGSMSGDKLELVKEAMKFVIDNLDSKDKLSVVLYDTEVSTLFDFSLMSTSQKEKSKKMVEEVKVGSSTNLWGGLERGIQLASKRKSPNEICSVLLFTDGLANQGQYQQSAPICSAMKSLMEKMTQKCTVFTFGFGSDHDEDMLRNIAESGNGMYYFVSKPDSIPTSFADCLGGLQSIVAQNLSLTVTSTKGVEILKSLNPKYKVKGSLPGNQVTIELADIYSEESRDIIFLVKVPQLKEVDENYNVVDFELKFFNTLSIIDEVCTASISISRPEKLDDKLQVNLDLDKQRNRLKAAEAMEESRKLAEIGKFEEAKTILDSSKKEIISSVSNNDDYCQKLALEMDQCMDDVSNVHVYQEKGSKNISRKAQAHYYQRSNKIEDEDISFYENTSKVASKAKSKGIW